MKKVLFIIANEGFQQTEYHVPKNIILKAGIEVQTASDKSVPAIAKDGSTAQVDFTLDQVNPNNFDGIFFIGGPGALDHLDNEKSYRIMQEAAKESIPLGAICISTRILANAEVLAGRKATGWDGDHQLADIYRDYDVQYIKKNVVVDRNIITATGPSAAEEFGEQIVALID